MPRNLALVLALAVPVIVILAAPAPALAHGDDVRLEVIEAEPGDGGSSVAYLVALTYVDDGHGIDDATVTATPIRAGSGAEAPVTLTPTGAGGGYEATVAFPAPGNWTVRFDAADPQASVTATHRVPNSTPTSAPPDTGPPPTSARPDTGPPPTSADVEPQLADDPDGGDDSPPTGLIVGLAVAGLALVVTGVVLVRRRRTSAPEAEPER